MPLIIRMPGRVPAGMRLDAPAQLIDLTPTILPLLGFSLEGAPFQGQDLFSLRPDEPRSLFALAAKLFTREPIRIAMVRGTHKFVVWPETGRQALYDLRSDPDEERDLLVTQSPKANGGEGLVDWSTEIHTWWSLGYIRR